MDAIKLTGHVGSDGILRLELPVDMTDQDLEIVLVIQTHPNHESPVDANGWPIGYFEATYGSLADMPIERPDQGVLETRDEID